MSIAGSGMPVLLRWRPEREGKQFFFEKKNQKTFVYMAHAAGKNRDSDIKVFCFFSSEKKTLLFH
jgi:hypothetical protein